MHFTFDFNVAALLQPAFLIAVGWLVYQAKKGLQLHFDQRHDAVEAKVEERHKETTTHLTAIEAQTTATNGRVLQLETNAKADHDLLMELKGTVDTLKSLKDGGR